VYISREKVAAYSRRIESNKVIRCRGIWVHKLINGGDEIELGRGATAGCAGYMDRSRQARELGIYKAGRPPPGRPRWPVRMKEQIDEDWAGRGACSQSKTLDRMIV